MNHNTHPRRGTRLIALLLISLQLVALSPGIWAGTEAVKQSKRCNCSAEETDTVSTSAAPLPCERAACCRASSAAPSHFPAHSTPPARGNEAISAALIPPTLSWFVATPTRSSIRSIALLPCSAVPLALFERDCAFLI